MNSWDNVLEAATYIDNGIRAFEKVVANNFYVPLSEPEYEDQVKKMNDAINELGEEVAVLVESQKKISSLQKLLQDTERCCQEVIKYGILCDLPISLTQTQQTTQFYTSIPVYNPESSYQKTPTGISSPSIATRKPQNKTPTKLITSGFREITHDEFDKLSIKLKYSNKFNDINNLYKTLYEKFDGEFTIDDVSRETNLVNTRITSLIESFLILKRIEKQGNNYLFI